MRRLVSTPVAVAGCLALAPTPIGVGRAFHPGPDGPTVDARGLACARERGGRFGVHLELFVRRRVVLVPAGIGIAPPRRREGASVRGGRCSFPARTTDPTGTIELRAGTRMTLGRFFRLWGRELSPTRLVGFRGRVRAFVGGREWRSDPRAIPLARHAEIVLEVGGYVPPHCSYLFPGSL